MSYGGLEQDLYRFTVERNQKDQQIKTREFYDHKSLDPEI